MPVTRNCIIAAGTSDTPSSAATRFTIDVMYGATWPMMGWQSIPNALGICHGKWSLTIFACTVFFAIIRLSIFVHCLWIGSEKSACSDTRKL
jgi:hypothetical protein